MKIDEFLEQNYIDRQLVIFVDDEMYEAKTQAEENGNSSPNNENYIKALLTIINPIASLKKQINAYKILFREIVDAINKLKASGVKINLLPKSIISNLNLLPGHPRNKVIYAGNPVEKKNFIPLADFHRITFEHKFSEILSILMHLGATEITVEHITGWGKEFSSQLSVPISEYNADIEADVDIKNSKKKSIIFKAKLKGNETPCLPDNLIWYDFENTWQKIAEGRIKFGLENFNLNLQYNDDFGINSSFIAKIEKDGFQLGGKYEKHISTVWNINGIFKND